jgi:hypothetical protein
MGIGDSMLKLGWLEDIAFEALLGHTITGVDVDKDPDEIRFTLAPHPDIPDGLRLKMFHYQDCCESVYVDDIAGDWADIIGHPLTLAEEVTQTNADDGVSPNTDEEYPDESFTWTFYKLATVKGYLTIRWYGSSNGYYSEAVSLARVGQAADE